MERTSGRWKYGNRERSMRLVKECTYIVPLLCKRALVHRWASWSLFIPNLLGREPFPLEESRGWGGKVYGAEWWEVDVTKRSERESANQCEW